MPPAVEGDQRNALSRRSMLAFVAAAAAAAAGLGGPANAASSVSGSPAACSTSGAQGPQHFTETGSFQHSRSSAAVTPVYEVCIFL